MYVEKSIYDETRQSDINLNFKIIIKRLREWGH